MPERNFCMVIDLNDPRYTFGDEAPPPSLRPEGAVAQRNGHAARPQTLLEGGAGLGDAKLAGALIDSAAVAIYRTDAESNITYVNPEYRRIFRLTPGQSAHDRVQSVHPD